MDWMGKNESLILQLIAEDRCRVKPSLLEATGIGEQMLSPSPSGILKEKHHG
jgi:hypothetical protein